MRIEHYSEEKLKKQILEIAGKYLNLDKYEIFFFGSRISGKGDERSDIDIGIEGDEPVPPAALEEIRDELEKIKTLYKIEIVDFKKVSPEFYNTAKQFIEIINNKK